MIAMYFHGYRCKGFVDRSVYVVSSDMFKVNHNVARFEGHVCGEENGGVEPGNDATVWE